MLGKIVELSVAPTGNGFEVIDGIEMYENGRKDYGFVSIVSRADLPKRARITYVYSYLMKKRQGLFKEYIISTDRDINSKPHPVLIEDNIWVIIPYSSGIESNARKIAGRNHTEGIFEMHAEETVTVRKAGCDPETYVVAQAGNELFLVKKNR